VDARTLEKYEKEAKEKNRDSWYMAYIMDTNEEERVKGAARRAAAGGKGGGGKIKAPGRC